MKIVCFADRAINTVLMSPFKELERYGHVVEIHENVLLQTPTATIELMLKAEQQGADAVENSPEIIVASKDADIIVSHMTVINSKVINAATQLKYVAVLRSGTEGVNLDVCKQRGIHVINAPGRSANAVADCTIGLMLAENKNLARGHKGLMEGKWIKDFVNRPYIHDLQNCTIGIVGAGQIGQKVIRRLSGFSCKTIVHDPFMTQVQIEEMGYTAVSLEELLAQSDFVSLHLRLSEKTEKFIGATELAQMKRTAYLINTSRAGVIDEEALVMALRNHTIGGAGLDVFSKEPLPLDHPFLSLDNVTLSPHVAGTSADTFSNSVSIIKHSLTCLFENTPIDGLLF